MVSSGVALVVYDSRLIPRCLRKIRNQFCGPPRPEQNVELGGSTNQGDPSLDSQTEDASIHENAIPVDSNNEIVSSLRNRQPRQQQITDTSPDSEQQPAPRVRAEDVMIPYSIRTGLVVFFLFVLSFVVTMVVQGVVRNSPILFQFYANMYLAGSSS